MKATRMPAARASAFLPPTTRRSRQWRRTPSPTTALRPTRERLLLKTKALRPNNRPWPSANASLRFHREAAALPCGACAATIILPRAQLTALFRVKHWPCLEGDRRGKDVHAGERSPARGGLFP